MMRGRNREETAGWNKAGIWASVFTPEDMLFFKAMKELHRLSERPGDRAFRDDHDYGVETRTSADARQEVEPARVI